jgi:ribosomal protein S18 acetylase RimI-like enzyme
VSGAVQVQLCGAERAGEIHRLTQLAFAPYAALDPPSGAVAESLEVVTADLALGGGALARPGGDGTAVGCLRWRLNDDGTFYVKRLAVDPGWQDRGVGRTLMRWACGEARARDLTAVTVGVRVALPGNLAFFRGLGFEVVGEHSHDGYARTTWLSLRQDL